MVLASFVTDLVGNLSDPSNHNRLDSHFFSSCTEDFQNIISSSHHITIIEPNFAPYAGGEAEAQGAKAAGCCKIHFRQEKEVRMIARNVNRGSGILPASWSRHADADWCVGDPTEFKLF